MNDLISRISEFYNSAKYVVIAGAIVLFAGCSTHKDTEKTDVLEIKTYKSSEELEKEFIKQARSQNNFFREPLFDRQYGAGNIEEEIKNFNYFK